MTAASQSEPPPRSRPVIRRPRDRPVRRGLSEQPTEFRGQAILWAGTFFDFEAGVRTANQAAADVWWEVVTGINGTTAQMVPLNRAALYAMGMVNFDSLSLSQLQGLPYSADPIPANPSGTNLMPERSVLAVRTKRGNYAKVLIIEYGDNPHIGWATYTRPIHFLDVKVTLGSTPDWLVTRYTAQCTYNTPGGVKNCGIGIFDHEGGIVQDQISDEGGAFPSLITVTVSIDFQPDTNLAALVKTFTPPVTNTGVNFIFEPYQVIQKTAVLLDLQPTPKAKDYLLLRWRHHDVDRRVVASGQKHLSGDELRQQTVTQWEIVFVPDPISAKDLNIEIDGRFQDKTLPLFTQTYELAKKAVLIRAKKSQSTRGYELVSD
jgi:hypothetical protein